jgi:TetR/AcrR family transcriptional regulator, transcriptional repressor for nem operon
MSRPRAFDEDDVRQRLADVFTANGFQGTSMAMLTDASGLGKQSLYNSFGDKEALYLDALDCVGERMAAATAALDQAPTGRAAIEAFFSYLLSACANPDPAVHLCIVSAGLLEGAPNAAAADKLLAKWHTSETLLRRHVKRGQADGSVRSDVADAELARLLITLVSGLRVAGRAVDSGRQLQATVRLGLEVLAPRRD